MLKLASKIRRNLDKKSKLCPKCQAKVAVRIMEGGFAVGVYCSLACGFALLVFNGGKSEKLVA